jgi:serpin B
MSDRRPIRIVWFASWTLAIIAAGAGFVAARQQKKPKNAAGDRPASASPTPAAPAGRIESTLAVPQKPEEPGSPAPAVDAEFAVALYRSIAAREPGKNLVISPAGVAASLAILQAGARGETADQIGALLRSNRLPVAASVGPPAPPAEVPDPTAPLPRAGKPSEFTIASSLWIAKESSILPEFQAAVGARARVGAVDLDDPSSRKPLEDWARDAAGGRVADLLHLGAIKGGFDLLLLNLVRFKGPWRTQFAATLTTPGPFHPAEGPAFDVPMMTMKRSFNYAEDEAFQVLEIPYDDLRHSFLLLVPRGRARLEDREYGLTTRPLLGCLGRMERTSIVLYLPRFSITCNVELERDLTRLDADRASTAQADFSGIDGTKRLRLSSLRQGTFINVNESGTEAGSATAATLTEKSLGSSPVVRADRPFLFMIVDKRTKSILFMGRVAEPERSAPRPG